MRSFLLKFGDWSQLFIIVTSTILIAFLLAYTAHAFFDLNELKSSTDLISSIYQVLGTIYAILLTFTLWGVWQNFSAADASAQNEAYALVDMVHVIESSCSWHQLNIRQAALDYSKYLIEVEWPKLMHYTNNHINMYIQNSSRANKIVEIVQGISANTTREATLFQEALTLLNRWMDARRSRILIARGNSAKSLWPLLLIGGFVLFTFHGLLVAESFRIWCFLLLSTSFIIGLTFYLIFSLDCPFTGSQSVDSEPFELAIKILS